MRPLIQIDHEVREMTDGELEQLLADGWIPDDEAAATETPAEELAPEQ